LIYGALGALIGAPGAGHGLTCGWCVDFSPRNPYPQKTGGHGGPPLRLCLNLKHPPQRCRTHPRASLRELESNKFCRHQAVYSPAGTARIVVSSRRGDSKGGHIGVSPFGVFFFCHFFLHKQKEMACNLSGIYNHRHCEPVRTPVWQSVPPKIGRTRGSAPTAGSLRWFAMTEITFCFCQNPSSCLNPPCHCKEAEGRRGNP